MIFIDNFQYNEFQYNKEYTSHMGKHYDSNKLASHIYVGRDDENE